MQQNSFDTRIDYAATSTISVFGRFSLDYSKVSGQGLLGELQGPGTGGGNIAPGWPAVPSPTTTACQLASPEYAQRAATLDPKLPGAHLLLGELYLYKSRVPEAIEQFQKN